MEKKLQKKNKLIYCKVCNVIGKTFYCIRKYSKMWDAQSHNITRRSRNDLESGCLKQATKAQKNTVFSALIIVLK